MKKGFTLIEIIVVVAMLAIAICAIIPSIKKIIRQNKEDDKIASIVDNNPVPYPIHSKVQTNSVNIELEKTEKTIEQIEKEIEDARIANEKAKERLEKVRVRELEKERKRCSLTRLCEVDGYTVYSVYDMSGGGTKVFAIPIPKK